MKGDRLQREIRTVEKQLRRKQKAMRAARASERDSYRFDVYDLEDRLEGLREQQRAQELW